MTILCQWLPSSTLSVLIHIKPYRISWYSVFVGERLNLGSKWLNRKNYSDCCLSLFKDAFGSTISDKFWHWKYPKDKKINSVVALKGNKAIAHYGLCDRRAVYNNVSYGFSQAADVMVASNERGAITSSVFYELVQLGEKPFFALDSNISVIYGFPHGRHYRLGARLRLYEPVSPIFEVVFDIPACTDSMKMLITSLTLNVLN
jgi:hypothetical protein